MSLSDRTFRLTAVACALSLALAGGAPMAAWAVQHAPADAHPVDGGDSVALELAPSLNLPLTSQEKRALPVFGSAERMNTASSPQGLVTNFEGNAELRKIGTLLRADRIQYWRQLQRIDAAGDVAIEQAGTRVVGPRLQLQLDSGKGTFDQPTYDLTTVGVRGKADRIDFVSNRFMQLFNGSFTSCRPDDESWRLEARRLDLDLEHSQGYGRDARFKVGDHTLLRMPVVIFPLNDARQSGFLFPTVSVNSRSGLGITAPYYFNLAPNYDLTVSPQLSTRRGLRLGNEFRFLTRPVQGSINLDYIPHDSDTNHARHSYDANGIFNGILGWNGAWSLQGVSDDNYFVDYSDTLIDASERSMPREVYLTRSVGDWNMMVRGVRYQNILEARQSPPYEKVPQLQFINNKVDLHGFDMTTLVDVTRFRSPRVGAVEGTRLVFNPQISFPVQGGGWFFTPKMGIHASYYSLDSHSETGRALSRVLPTFSIDSGLVLERDSQWLGAPSIQTLEPRLFYVRTPYRNQSDIPVFDSVATDLSFAQLFSENAFTGHDRVADADHLTAALVSRQIERSSGVERLRMAIAQRFYFSSQDVTIPGQPVRVDRRSDVLFAGSGELRGGHSMNIGVQYALRDRRVPRLNLSYRYRPGGRKLFNVGVRYQAREYAQWDTSLVWPIAGNWTALGRINYSFLKQDLTTGQAVDVNPGLVEGLLGVEYARDCWAVRLVAHRFVTTTHKTSTVGYLQFDLRGLGHFGQDPFGILARNIPGYSLPDNHLAPAVRYYGYE
ncbi:MAG: LPS-assembly protein LptD [Lautropia sp.]|nr:LPS-assembly protein LptD [Lautropia sp.]